jgi:hypothetical protein
MLSNASAIVATFARPRAMVKPMTVDGGHSQGPLAGPDNSTQRQLVERIEAKGDDWATWQIKPITLVHAPIFRPRSRRVRRHPVAVAARLAARLLEAARSAASRAAVSATNVALKHGLIAAPRQVIPNAIKWGPQVAGRDGINQATRTIGRAARRGARRAGATSGRVIGTAGQRSREAVTLQPAQGATKMGHLMRALKITGFVIKWGAHLSTLAAGVWMLHGMVVIKSQANKELRLLNNHLVKQEGKEGPDEKKEYQDDARLMDIYPFPGYQVEIEVPTNPDGSSKQVILDEAIRDEVDPVVLGEAGVSVYEIPKEKTKLPVDDWVDLEDLGMDDDTHPKDVGPVEMATPAPNQKVWLASEVHRMSPMMYSEADITTDRPDSEVDIRTDRPDISTAKTPKARSTRRQGRSFMSPEGDVISEASLTCQCG